MSENATGKSGKAKRNDHLRAFPSTKESFDAMSERMEAYFKESPIITVHGLMLAMGFRSRRTFRDYRESKKESPEAPYSELIEYGLMRLFESKEEALADKATAVGAMFTLKCSARWDDRPGQTAKIDVKHSGGTDNKTEVTYKLDANLVKAIK